MTGSAVAAHVAGLALPGAWLAVARGQIAGAAEEQLAARQEVRVGVRARRRELERQQAALVEAVAEGLLPVEAVRARQQELQRQQLQLQAAEAGEDGAGVELLLERVTAYLELLERPGELYQALPEQLRGQLLEVLFEQLYLDTDPEQSASTPQLSSQSSAPVATLRQAAESGAAGGSEAETGAGRAGPEGPDAHDRTPRTAARGSSGMKLVGLLHSHSSCFLTGPTAASLRALLDTARAHQAQARARQLPPARRRVSAEDRLGMAGLAALRADYESAGLSDAQLTAKYSLSRSTIFRLARRHGMQRPPRPARHRAGPAGSAPISLDAQSAPAPAPGRHQGPAPDVPSSSTATAAALPSGGAGEECTARPGWKPRPRLTAAEVEAMVAGYQAGCSVVQLAAQFGRHRATISAVLKRNGIRLRTAPLPPERVRYLIDLYRSGLSLQQVGQRLGVNASTVRNHLRRAGVPRRVVGG